MKNIELKKVLLGVLATVMLLVAADWAVGTWSEKMYYKSRYGIFHRQIYCLQESKEDILILGSSRAAHHYVPQIFEDSLGMSCYNAGSDGMCIYYHYGILAGMISRGHIPSLVIYEVMPDDVLDTHRATFTLEAALDRLAPHYGEVDLIDSIFALNGWKETLKLKIKTYRYNSKLVQTIKCNFFRTKEERGYEGYNGVLKEIDNKSISSDDYCFDDSKIKYVRKFITLCHDNGIRLYFYYSPSFGGRSSSGIVKIKEVAEEYNVPFDDYSDIYQFQGTPLYYDRTHLNDFGAHEYSRFVASELKTKLFH